MMNSPSGQYVHQVAVANSSTGLRFSGCEKTADIVINITNNNIERNLLFIKSPDQFLDVIKISWLEIS